MSDKFPTRGDFNIPSTIIDEYEWVADSFIDSMGIPCKLVYPPKMSECTNCYIDNTTGRSSNIYKSGGPLPFQNHQICPLCEGRGRLSLEETDNITLRVYWTPKDWYNIGLKIESPDGVAMTIGYINDLPKIERADYIILNSNLESIRQYKVRRMGEAVPFGLKQRRYFIQYVKRT